MVDGGTKADTPKEVEEAKSKLRMKEITGIANQGNEGLGWRKRQYYSSSNKTDRRDMVVKEVREKEEQRRRTHIVGLSNQGASTRWEVPEKRLSHEEIIRTQESRLRFLIRAVYDLLPTPANKNRWFKQEEKCKICGGEGTLNHILAGCKASLAQGRYKWRHDKVLGELGRLIKGKIDNVRSEPRKEKQFIGFVKEGERVDRTEGKKDISSILDKAKDWKMQIDLQERVRIPETITSTNMRPDIILISEEARQMIMIELTVPTEDRIEISGELKRAKYTPIVEEGKQNGWGISIWAVEVGCRGFPARSMSSLLKAMGFQGKERKKALKRLGEKAEEASRAIWGWSNMKEWGRTQNQEFTK